MWAALSKQDNLMIDVFKLMLEVIDSLILAARGEFSF
jgi:hypothetical protein